MKQTFEIYELDEHEIEPIFSFLGGQGFLRGPCYFNKLTLSSAYDQVKGLEDEKYVGKGTWFGKEFPRQYHDVHFCDGKFYLRVEFSEGIEAKEALKRYRAMQKSHVSSQL